MHRQVLRHLLRFGFTFFAFYSTVVTHAQIDKDSVKQVIETAESYSLRVEGYQTLSDYADNPQEGLDYALKGYELATQNNFIFQKGQLANSLGIWYYAVGDFEQTLNYFYKAQEAFETLQDTTAMARSYNNIGLILSDLGQLQETIKYHKMSLAIKKSINDSIGMANSYSNLGLAYEALDSLDIALDYYKKALKIDLKAGDSYDLYTIYSNIGQNYFKRKQYDSTTLYYNKAIMLSDEIDNKFNKAELLRDYGALDAAQKEFERAIEKYNAGLRLAKEIQAQIVIRDCYLGLSDIYEQLDDVNRAFNYYVKYDSVNDLIFNAEQSEKIASIEQNYKIQRGQKEIELLRKEAEIKDLRLRNNTYLLYSLGAAVLLIVAIVILQYRKNIYKTRTNKLLKKQHDEIAEKNKNIMDSIQYAKNIQKAILPAGEKLSQIFTDSFVLSKARDVVNGDFYWFAEKGNKVVIAAVDCTGHGVPAAFLNVIGNSHLNNIVHENGILEPAAILERLNERVISSMHGNDLDSHSDDGMDIGLCLFDKSTMQLKFAGAKRPVYYFNNGDLKIIKGDGHPVGGDAYDPKRSYKQHKVTLQSNDSIYLFTDGIVDQFGGKKNKKFMYPRLRELLRKIHDQSMSDQRMVIKDDLMTWKGDLEQTDDILIIGIRV